MKLSPGCSGITNHACTQRSATQARSSSNSSGIAASKHWPANGKQSRLWKSRKANNAFQLSHSHDDEEL
jgi:hypothetical protein